MTKITDLTQLTAAAATDKLAVVDVSDTGQAASGSTKHVDMNDIFGDTTPVPYDLKFNSANGVNFGNETLHNYVEAGSWTPTVVGATSGVGSYTTQSGRYTRIGDLFFCSFRVDFTKNTISGDVRVGGLPATASLGSVRCGVAWGLVDEITFTDMFAGDIVTATTYITLRDITQGGAVTNITDSDLHASNSMILAGSVFYHA